MLFQLKLCLNRIWLIIYFSLVSLKKKDYNLINIYLIYDNSIINNSERERELRKNETEKPAAWPTMKYFEF